MKKILKNIFKIITIVGFAIFSYFWILYGAEWIRQNYDVHSSTQQFVGVLLLTLAAIFFRKLKEKPKYKEIANLWQWFMITLVPTPVAFAAVIQEKISLYWGLFAFVLAATIWISIGVYNGTHFGKKWDKDYKFNFGVGIFAVLCIGVMIHYLLTIIAVWTPEKLLP